MGDTQSLLLLALSGCIRSPFLGPLLVDACSEWVLILQSNQIDRQHPRGKKYTRRSAVHQRRAEETHGRAVVHGRVADVEGESGDHFFHEDTAVVAKEGACNAQGVRRGQNQDVTECDQPIAKIRGNSGLEERMGWLVAQGALVEKITHETEGEDCGGEGVASCLRVTPKGLGQEASAVFSSGDNAGGENVSQTGTLCEDKSYGTWRAER